MKLIGPDGKEKVCSPGDALVGFPALRVVMDWRDVDRMKEMSGEQMEFFLMTLSHRLDYGRVNGDD